jgi:hypothetical protein
MSLVFLILSFLLFLLAGCSVTPPRVQLGWLGAACFVLAQIWPIAVR